MLFIESMILYTDRQLMFKYIHSQDYHLILLALKSTATEKHHKSLDSGLGYPFCHFSDIIFMSCVGLCQWVSACLSVTERVGGLGWQKLCGAESGLLSTPYTRKGGEKGRDSCKSSFAKVNWKLRKCCLSAACVCSIFCLFVPAENLIKMARLLRVFPLKILSVSTRLPERHWWWTLFQCNGTIKKSNQANSFLNFLLDFPG